MDQASFPLKLIRLSLAFMISACVLSMAIADAGSSAGAPPSKPPSKPGGTATTPSSSSSGGGSGKTLDNGPKVKPREAVKDRLPVSPRI